MEEVRIFKVHG